MWRKSKTLTEQNRDDPDAEEKVSYPLPLASCRAADIPAQFKQIAVAYQVLSDVDLRKKYNEFGQKNGGGGADEGLQDPEEVFGKMFGGDRFDDLIGTISIGTCFRVQPSWGSATLESWGLAGA